MESVGLTASEATPYYILLVIVAFTLVNNFRKGYREFWSPLTIISLILGYYCLLGPYQTIKSGNTYDRLLDMRPFYTNAFWGAVVSLVSCIVGFSVNKKAPTLFAINNDWSDQNTGRYGRHMFLIGFSLFTISVGGNVGSLINPLDAQGAEQIGGGLSNYLNLAVNFLIPAVCLLFIHFLRTRNGFWWFVIAFLIAIGLFTTLGFRYRIVLLVGSVVVTYYMILKKRPNPFLLVGATALFIVAMGFIEMTRQYGGGLKLDYLNRAQNKNSSYYESGLKEARIFQTSGAVITLVPEKKEHVGFEPVVQTLLFPIPKVFYDEKNSAGYLFSTLDLIYGEKLSKGAAFLMYGEYYLAFGWVGIVIGSFLIGFFYKGVWIWFKANSDNAFVIVAYAVTVVYLYVILSRGYLPQVTMLFFFSVYPIYYVIRRAKKQYSNSSSQSIQL